MRKVSSGHMHLLSLQRIGLDPAVVDKSGSHLARLKREDFALKQDGKSQRITIFEEVKTTTTRVRMSFPAL